jgi:hypothetical protein
MRQLFLMSGGFGAGKTYLSHNLATTSNTVALASSMRVLLMKCFRGDSRICSTKQEVKNEIFGEHQIKEFLRRERVKGLDKQLFLTFQQDLAEQKNINTLTVRNMLEIFGGAGRKVNKNYWLKKTVESLSECEGNILCVDDVRFINELDYLNKWAKKNNIKVFHFFIGEVDEYYDNQALYSKADYIMDWRK